MTINFRDAPIGAHIRIAGRTVVVTERIRSLSGTTAADLVFCEEAGGGGIYTFGGLSQGELVLPDAVPAEDHFTVSLGEYQRMREALIHCRDVIAIHRDCLPPKDSFCALEVADKVLCYGKTAVPADFAAVEKPEGQRDQKKP